MRIDRSTAVARLPAAHLLHCPGGMIALGAVPARRTFAMSPGDRASPACPRHPAQEVFADSLPLPFAPTLSALGVIATGIAWQRREPALDAPLRPLVPCPRARGGRAACPRSGSGGRAAGAT